MPEKARQRSRDVWFVVGLIYRADELQTGRQNRCRLLPQDLYAAAPCQSIQIDQDVNLIGRDATRGILVRQIFEPRKRIE